MGRKGAGATLRALGLTQLDARCALRLSDEYGAKDDLAEAGPEVDKVRSGDENVGAHDAVVREHTQEINETRLAGLGCNPGSVFG